jgi:hypothetical protein
MPLREPGNQGAVRREPLLDERSSLRTEPATVDVEGWRSNGAVAAGRHLALLGPEGEAAPQG